MLSKKLSKPRDKENTSVSGNQKYNTTKYLTRNVKMILSQKVQSSPRSMITECIDTLKNRDESSPPQQPSPPYKRDRYVQEYFSELHLFNYRRMSPPSYCLRNHQVESSLRARMIDWMVEVMSSYKFSNYAFFKAVDLMDRYFSKEQTSQQNNRMHLIGVTTIYMISKLEEVEPLRMSVLVEKIAHKKLGPKEILGREYMITTALDFDLMAVTCYDIAVLVLRKLAQKFPIIENNLEAIEDIVIYILKIIMHSYETTSNYSKHAIGVGAVLLSLVCSNSTSPAARQSLEEVYCEDDPIEDVVEVLARNVIGYEKDYPSLQNVKRFSSVEYGKVRSKLVMLGY